MTRLRTICRQMEPLLPLRVTDELTADETAMVDQHVRYCEPCCSLLKALTNATAALHEASVGPATCEGRPSLWERIEPRLGPAGRLRRRPTYWIRTWQLAAACVALIAITFAIEMRRPPEEAASHARSRRAALADFAPSAYGAIRPVLGVLVQAVDRVLADRLRLDSTCGAVVADVAPDSPADRAGLQPGDVIIGFDTFRVHSPEQLSQLVAARRVGATVVFDVVRAGWQGQVEVRLGAW